MRPRLTKGSAEVIRLLYVNIRNRKYNIDRKRDYKSKLISTTDLKKILILAENIAIMRKGKFVSRDDAIKAFTYYIKNEN